MTHQTVERYVRREDSDQKFHRRIVFSSASTGRKRKSLLKLSHFPMRWRGDWCWTKNFFLHPNLPPFQHDNCSKRTDALGTRLTPAAGITWFLSVPQSRFWRHTHNFFFLDSVFQKSTVVSTLLQQNYPRPIYTFMQPFSFPPAFRGITV